MCGVRLFLQHHVHAYQFGFVAQHVDKASMWHLHKVLVVARSNADLLLPFGVLSITIRIIPLQENKHDDRFARKWCVEIHLVSVRCRQAIHQGRACKRRVSSNAAPSVWTKSDHKERSKQSLETVASCIDLIDCQAVVRTDAHRKEEYFSSMKPA
jgi:hypothetical protein